MPSKDEEYDAFVLASWPSLFRLATLLSNSHHDAEDLMQSTMCKLFRSWRRVAKADHPRSYARTVLVHEAISWHRRKSNHEAPTLSLYDLPPRLGHEDSVVTSVDVWRAIQLLSPRQRAVIVLRYYEDMSEAQIADVLEISKGSVKTHASHALKALNQVLTSSNEPSAPGGRK